MATPSRAYHPLPSPRNMAVTHPVQRAPSNFDEGFSEETQSQPESDVELDMRTDAKLPDTVDQLLDVMENLTLEQRVNVVRQTALGLSPEDQLELANSLLALLPTWAKQQASAHLDSLMFFDPVAYLPVELVALVLGNLSPRDLLHASGVNRAWRDRTQDEELWRSCVAREGWRVDRRKMKRYEHVRDERRARQANIASKSGSQMLARKDSRKRRREEAFSESELSRRGMDGSTDDCGSSYAESEDDMMDGLEMQGVADARGRGGQDRTQAELRAATSSHLTPRHDRMDAYPIRRPRRDFKLEPTEFQVRASLADNLDSKLSWAYVYKKRRQLEKNWDDGKYKMFKLPHPQFENEGHTECVYTIQHTNDWLVSGSRDRSIRVWDLATSRLKRAMTGHEQSVLCLQFDPTPENDIIVSGGSDSWVIIWKFSTGEIIKKMTDAHTESVLNLRFDDRYLVTCSKDKTIKLWSRHAMTKMSPLLPAHTIDHCAALSKTDIIAEHSLLATLRGHHAAVNAVMIYESTIVSASGDRTIRNWNLHTGKTVRTYTGHTKGIACVQYDGRRIISGSSDNSVRIFDAETAAEVASLTGHTSLVRTVQARFGDLAIKTDEDLHAESRAADKAFYNAVDAGMESARARRGSPRNAGSSRPDRMLATGTKVPPGGGGSRWAKIVSGSYDQTIIIWKQDRDGNWTQKHRLHQDFLLMNRGAHRRAVPANAVAHPANLHNLSAQALAQPNSQAHGAAQAALAQAHGLLLQAQSLTTQGALPAHVQPAQVAAIAAQHQQHAAQVQNLQQQIAPPALVPGPAATAVAAVQAAHIPGQTATLTANAQQAHPPTAGTQAAAAHAHAAAQAQAQANRENSNRVFKLQFDARRIVCCSQNRVIVGWDFANGDEELGRVGGWFEETF
ncbi:hypothetical protein B0A48_15741 [Cryoendolithus antarcticus]|uniref:F-box domain-containing protein n=1 Tax=Cryoendolithus antarcticus TaxID=1507870 RepID=A0A1V8SHY1_9PEZI|nr:hypothetical protein B0A48_15741 [Cryoendolithus antarcticus]